MFMKCKEGENLSRYFYFLWTSISFGKLAMSLYTMSLTLIVFFMTNSATLASLIMLVHVLGKMISSFVFPLVSEHKSLKKILGSSLFMQTFLVTLVFMVNLSILGIYIKLIIIYILIMLTGFLDGFVSPSRLSLIPQIVNKAKIGKANSLISTTDQSLALLGWSVGPIIGNFFGYNFILATSLFLLIISTLSSLKIKNDKLKTVERRPRLEVIKEGWFVLFSKKNHLRTITTMDILEGIASGIWIGGVTLLFVSQILKEGEEWWGFINAGYYIGSIVGGVIVTIYSHKLKHKLLLGISLGSFSVSLLVLMYAINTTAWVALLLVILMGPFYQLRDISQQTYIQTVVVDNTLSKIYAAKGNIYYFTFSLSVLITGLLSDHFGVVYVYYLAFGLYFLSTLLSLMIFPKKLSL